MATLLYFDVGGRPYNSQDFQAIQSQVIDATQVYAAFNNGNNYIIQGCATRGASGTVWLNNKVRAVATEGSITNATPFPLWIIAQDSNVSRVYQDGQAKTAFQVYNAVWTTTTPGQGVSFIQFNSQADLNNLRLVTFITPDAVPTSGGTYTGSINVNGLGGVTTNNGLGGNLIPETGSADNGRYRLGLGMNLTWNGNSWVSLSDSSHNGSAIVYSDIFGASINFGIYPNSNGASNRLLSPSDIDSGVKMTLNSTGDLSVTHNISATNLVSGDTLSATTSVNASTINMSKKQLAPNYGISTINFAAEVNDPGFITHEENNNSSIMKFSVSDDAYVDYFSFGSTPNGNYIEAFRINTSGSASLTGQITAADFALPSDERLKKNITKLVNSLDVVNALNPVEFDMIDVELHMSGFIAQEVEKIIPHAVVLDNEYLALKELQIIPYLVKAIQELNSQVNDLKTQIAALQKK